MTLCKVAHYIVLQKQRWAAPTRTKAILVLGEDQRPADNSVEVGDHHTHEHGPHEAWGSWCTQHSEFRIGRVTAPHIALAQLRFLWRSFVFNVLFWGTAWLLALKLLCENTEYVIEHRHQVDKLKQMERKSVRIVPDDAITMSCC